MERLGEILSRTANVGSSPRTSPAAADGEGAQEQEAQGVCTICGGAGFVRRERSLDDPRFGRAEPCACVLAESEEAKRERLARLSNLQRLRRFTFAALEEPPHAGLVAPSVLGEAKAYALSPEGWLAVLGPSGAGKTLLTAAIANARIDEGLPVLFMVTPDLLDHLRAGYTSSDAELSYAGLLAQVRDTPFLILDDIDAVAPTEWAREKLFQILNHRLISGLATVLTYAKPERLEERLLTRLRSSVVAELRLRGRGVDYTETGGMTRDRLAVLNFANFDLGGAGLEAEERDSLVAAHTTAREFAERPAGFLTLLGVNGCGKTHIAAAVANRALARGMSVHFAVVPDLLDQLRASFGPGHDAAVPEGWRRAREADLVVLDDLGAQASTPWAQDKLFQIVNYRALAELPTVVTSDCDREQLRSLHPRIAARIFDPRIGLTIAIIAPHYTLGRGGGGRRRGGYR